MVLESESDRDRDQSPETNVHNSDNYITTAEQPKADGSGTGAENIRFLKMRLPKMIQERRNLAADTSFRSEISEHRADGTSTAEKSVGGNSCGGESLGSSASFPDRRKKKPKFQEMLERARKEEIRLRSEEKKPLFMRIQEKTIADSDRDEQEKIELSRKERTVPKKKNTASSRDGGSISTAPEKNTVPKHTKQSNSGNAPGKARVINSDPEISSSDVENRDNNQRVSQKKSSKTQPLFQRLAAQAKIESEREAKDKLDKYNMIRLQKQAAKAPTREELKERERFLEAEMERNKEQKNKKKLCSNESENNPEENSRERRSLSQGNTPPIVPRDNSKPHSSPDRIQTKPTNEVKDGDPVDKKIRSGIPRLGRQSIDSNNRQVSYHDDTTPLHPRGQPLERVLQQRWTSSSTSSSVVGNNYPAVLERNPLDETGELFSPISMTSMGGDSRYSSGNGKKLRGKFGSGIKIQGTHLVDICGDGDDHDDDDHDDTTVKNKSSCHSLVSRQVCDISPSIKPQPQPQQPPPPQQYEVDANVSPTTEGKALQSSKEDDPVVAEKEEVKQDDKNQEQDCESEIASVQSVSKLLDHHQVPIVGDQYVADVLETEEGEGDLAVLYTEGFSAYMEMQGLIV